jgi:hypothetical protein
MKCAIMQPYVFPYIGYFQLITAVDKFVFYDDVNFTSKGWVNRNNILINNEKKLISLPCKKASQNKQINDIEVNTESKEYTKILKTIAFNYKKAPFFNDTYSIIHEVLTSSYGNIGLLAQQSIIEVLKYLKVKKEVFTSSESFAETKGMYKADRLISICKSLSAVHYINAIGGQEIYQKKYFQANGIKLSFLKSNAGIYNQFKGNFIPNLSIIDVLMFNSAEAVHEMLDNYELI